MALFQIAGFEQSARCYNKIRGVRCLLNPRLQQPFRCTCDSCSTRCCHSILRRLQLLEIWWERYGEMEWKSGVNFPNQQYSGEDRLMVWCTVLSMCVCQVFMSAWDACLWVRLILCVWSRCSYRVWFIACGGKLNHFSRPLQSSLSHRKITLLMQPHLHTKHCWSRPERN